MQKGQKQKAIVVKKFGQIPEFDQADIPQPKQNEVKIKVIASTINPSDRASVRGGYRKTSVPFVGGLQGFGQVVQAGSQKHSKWVGKKVSFTTSEGSWAQYSIANVDYMWEIDEDVPVQCSASGIVNPLTVIGIVDTYKKWNNHGVKGSGMINTAAASALGRMLVKYCKRQNVPLLNIVRRKEQVKLLEEDGATFIIDTSSQNWIEQYKQLIAKQGFNVLFDAIGGGEVTQLLISNLKPCSQVYIYGMLSKDPFIMRKPIVGFQGTAISNFMLFEWYSRISQEERQQIRKNYSSLLKNQLSTKTLKTVQLQQVPDIWVQAQKRATEGKYTILIGK